MEELVGVVAEAGQAGQVRHKEGQAGLAGEPGCGGEDVAGPGAFFVEGLVDALVEVVLGSSFGRCEDGWAGGS